MVKSPRSVFVLSGLTAVIFWVSDALVDFSLHYDEPFLQVLLFSKKEVAFRILGSVCFLLFGLFMARAFAKQKAAEAKLTDEIAERMKAEDSLRSATKAAEDERAKARAIIDSIGDGISVQDSDFRVLYQNRAHLKMIGGEHTGEYCYEKYSQTNKVCKGCPVERSFQDGKSHTFIKSVQRDWGMMHIEIKASPVTSSTGEIVAGIEVVRDITERRQMEEELLRHLAAMEASLDGMAITDRKGTYLYLNDAHAKIYGYDNSRELVGKTWKALYYIDEVRRFEQEVFPLLGEKGAWRGEAVGRRKDGSIFHQELSLTSLEDGGVVCVVRDVSDRKSDEREREKLIFELRDALANIKILRGLLPMCAWCKKIRDDQGYWKQVETYIAERSDAEFTHGICPDCLRKGDPELYEKISEDPDLRRKYLENGGQDGA